MSKVEFLKEKDLVLKVSKNGKVSVVLSVSTINHFLKVVVLRDYATYKQESVSFKEMEEGSGDYYYKKLVCSNISIEDVDISSIKSAEDLKMRYEVEKSSTGFTITVFADDKRVYSITKALSKEDLDTLEVGEMLNDGLKVKYYDLNVSWGIGTGIWEGFSILLNLSADGKLLDDSPLETDVRHAERIVERRYCEESDTVFYL